MARLDQAPTLLDSFDNKAEAVLRVGVKGEDEQKSLLEE